jgi:hypothetical protein
MTKRLQKIIMKKIKEKIKFNYQKARKLEEDRRRRNR